MADCCECNAENESTNDSASHSSPRYVYDADEHAGEATSPTFVFNVPSSETCAVYVTTVFQDGPLGVNLRRRPIDGIVNVTEIIEDSQAINLDLEIGDELWSIENNELGARYLEKQAWQGMIEYIKHSARPLHVIWRRQIVQQQNAAEQTVPAVNTEATSSAVLNAGYELERVKSVDKSNREQQHQGGKGSSEQHEQNDDGDEADTVGQVSSALSQSGISNGAPISSPAAHSPAYVLLESVLSKLIRKPNPAVTPTAGGSKHSSSKHAQQQQQQEEFPYRHLLKEDRRLLRRGELSTPGQTTLWMAKTFVKKHIILLSDLLIVTTPVMVSKFQCFQVEHIIDLQACKLRSNGQVFGGGLQDAVTGGGSGGKGIGGGGKGGVQSPTNGGQAGNSSAADRQVQESSFQVIWPGGSLQLIADSRETKEVWVLNLFLAVCARVGGESNGKGQVLGWRHQYMLGTMHSAVLSHDETHVRELVGLCDAGEMEFSSCIDASDEDGYTPLHYACIMRMHGIVRALHEATADVTAPDHRGLTPLHWAAMQLDDYTLSLLCSHVFDLDLYDKLDRTPLYMACVEGRDFVGHTDNSSLRKCVACMLTHQPNVNLYDREGYTMLHYLAASWQYETMELLLYADADVNARCARGGMMPLHLACLAAPIKRAVGEAARIIQGADAAESASSAGNRSTSPVPAGSGSASPPIATSAAAAAGQYEKLNHPFGSTTLRALLKAGARPNAKDSRGRTALHILAELGRDDLWDLMELTDGVSVLVSFGARFDDSPALAGLKSRMLGISVDALAERWASLPVINGDALNLT